MNPRSYAPHRQHCHSIINSSMLVDNCCIFSLKTSMGATSKKKMDIKSNSRDCLSLRNSHLVLLLLLLLLGSHSFLRCRISSSYCSFQRWHPQYYVGVILLKRVSFARWIQADLNSPGFISCQAIPHLLHLRSITKSYRSPRKRFIPHVPMPRFLSTSSIN